MGTKFQDNNPLVAVLMPALCLLAACNSPAGTDFPPDRQKLLVTDDNYLKIEDCWGGFSLQEEGVWIPVEFAVDKKERFTKIGISSRTCELQSIVEFELEATKFPTYYPFERHADFFEFVVPNLRDPEGLFGSSELQTSVSTLNVRYSDNVVFFDGYIMLGSPVMAPSGGREFFNVVEVAKSPR